ncbi:MAG: hypothetical protein AAF065_13935 [Verrucomicrobiota bacterium]
MKAIIPIVFVLAALLSVGTQVQAAYPVIDFRAIYTEIVNSRRDLAQQITQVQNQRQQILQLTSQIAQLDDYLDRFGNPAQIRLQELKDLYQLVRELPVSKSSKELRRLLSDDILFIDQDVYDPISKDITVDGEVVTARDTSVYKPDLAARQGFLEYHKLQNEALEKRNAIDRDLQVALRKLEGASTASEVEKLAVVISSLNAQRAEVSREIDLAASAAMTRHLQNQAETEIAQKARDQEQRATLKVGMRKSLNTYRFPSGPTLFNP